MIIGRLELRHTVECKCGYEATGGSLRAAFFWLAVHAKVRCTRPEAKNIQLLRLVWALRKVKP